MKLLYVLPSLLWCLLDHGETFKVSLPADIQTESDAVCFASDPDRNVFIMCVSLAVCSFARS